jgi:hypothetical protein
MPDCDPVHSCCIKSVHQAPLRKGQSAKVKEKKAKNHTFLFALTEK